MSKPTADQQAALFDFYEHGSLSALAKRLGTDRAQLHAWAKQLGLKPRCRHKWTKAEDQYLRDHYANGSGRDMAKHLGIAPHVLYKRAAVLGLAKADNFLSELAKRTGLPERGRPHRIAPGSTPPNKGKKMSPELYAKAKPTMWGKGHMPHNWVPIGTETKDRDGYLKRKVSDDRTKASRFNWKFVHVLLWEEHHGPIPAGHMVCFRDGDKDNLVISNLELITMKENIARNSIINMPPELQDTYRAMGQLTKAINRHGKQE